MLRRNYQQILELLLIFSLFFIANSTAFIHVVWLVPEIVFMALVVWLVLAIFCIWILGGRNIIPDFVESLKRNWVILPFMIFSGLSIFWSVYWEISLFRWLTFILTLITGGYIGLRYNIKEIIKLLSIFGVYVLFLSSILVFFMPQIGVMNYYIIQGAWKGLYWHKNHMGLIAVFINILFLINIVYSMRAKEKGTLFWGILYLYSLLFIYQTDSVAAYMTAIILHGVLLLALFLLKFGRKFRASHYFVLSIVLIFAFFVVYLNADYIFGMFNRNTSLTGRVPMWTYLFETYISKRPILGYGFNAFWYLDTHQLAVQQAAGYPDPIIIADNGFIDILVNTGYAGLILFSIFYLSAWWHSIKYASSAKDVNGMFPVILMSFTLLANISWSLIFENEGFFMLVMIIVLFSTSVNKPQPTIPFSVKSV